MEIKTNFYILDDKLHHKKLKDFILWAVIPYISIFLPCLIASMLGEN